MSIFKRPYRVLSIFHDQKLLASRVAALFIKFSLNGARVAQLSLENYFKPVLWPIFSSLAMAYTLVCRPASKLKPYVNLRTKFPTRNGASH